MSPVNTAETPIHVLLLADELRGLEFSEGATKGLSGLETALAKVLRLMPRERYRFSIASLSSKQILPPVDQCPYPFHVFALKKTYDWNALKMAVRLRRLIRSERVDIVHTFFESADVWGGVVAKLSGCPILVSGRRDMGYFRSAKHRFAYRIVNNMVDQVQAVSEQVRSFVISEDRLDPQKVVTVYNGIDMKNITAADGLASLSVQLRLEQGAPVITAVANIRPVKGLDVLIRAASIVCRALPRARFFIVGKVLDRPHFDQLQELARTLGLGENVVFLGSSDKVISLLKLSTVFCLLSRSEGFSNAILEAMATGLPCVVTRVGGNPEAVEEGQTGFLVASEDADAAADRILRLLRHPDLAKQMGECGRKTIATKFTAEAMVRRWEKLYDDVLSARRNRWTSV